MGEQNASNCHLHLHTSILRNLAWLAYFAAPGGISLASSDFFLFILAIKRKLHSSEENYSC